jgi:hypothetical protein
VAGSEESFIKLQLRLPSPLWLQLLAGIGRGAADARMRTSAVCVLLPVDLCVECSTRAQELRRAGAAGTDSTSEN